MGVKPPPTVAVLRLVVAGDGLGDAISPDNLDLVVLPLGDVILVAFRGDSGELLDDFRRLAAPPKSSAFSLAPTLGLGFRLGEGFGIIMSDAVIFVLDLEFDDATVSLILADFRGAMGEPLLLLSLTSSLALRVVRPGGDNRWLLPSDSVSLPDTFALFFFLPAGDMGLALLLDARDDGLEGFSTTSCCLRFPANGVLERRFPLRSLSSSSLESNIDPAGALALRMFEKCRRSFLKVRGGVSVGGEEDGGGGGEGALALRFTTAGEGFLASKSSSLSLLSAVRRRGTSCFCDTLFFFFFAGDFDSPPCISDILRSTGPEERVDSPILSSCDGIRLLIEMSSTITAAFLPPLVEALFALGLAGDFEVMIGTFS
jgi:hypothetical protein